MHVDEPRIAPDTGRAHLEPLHRPDPAAIAHRDAGDRQSPAVGLDRAQRMPVRIDQRNPPKVVERQGAAVVQLAPGIDVERQAGVPRDMHAVDRQRLRPTVQQNLDAEADKGVHGRTWFGKRPVSPGSCRGARPTSARPLARSPRAVAACVWAGVAAASRAARVVRWVRCSSVLLYVLHIVWWIVIAHVIMSWLINFNVLNRHQPLVWQIWTGLEAPARADLRARSAACCPTWAASICRRSC